MPDELTIQVRLEETAFWATVDEFPGVFATGDTLDELRESLEEGISLYMSGEGATGTVKLGSLTGSAPMATSAHAELVPA